MRIKVIVLSEEEAAIFDRFVESAIGTGKKALRIQVITEDGLMSPQVMIERETNLE